MAAASSHRTDWFRANVLVRIVFLLLTPTLFRWLNFAFVWHSIYWGAITVVVLLWGSFILLSPLLGRAGCGWVCFMGTVQDLVGEHAVRQHSIKHPEFRRRLFWAIAFLGSAAVFFVINQKAGLIPGWRFSPNFLPPIFNEHYKHVWLYDTLGAMVFALFLNKRCLCRVCPMGTLCAIGARHSRLLPVLERSACNECKACERTCPVAIPILERASRHHGLVVDGDCLNCGRCQAACAKGCVKMAFVWNRNSIPLPRPDSVAESCASLHPVYLHAHDDRS